MSRIAYITDLHIGSEQGKSDRRQHFMSKAANLPKDVSAFVLGGDTLSVSNRFSLLEQRPFNLTSLDAIKEEQSELAESFMDELFNSTCLPVFMSPGNTDNIAYSHLASCNYSGLHLIDGELKSFVLGMNIIGLSGIYIDRAEKYYIFVQDAYPGYLDRSMYYERLRQFETLSNDWSNTVLVTHLPASGHVDIPWPTPFFLKRFKGKVLRPMNKGEGDPKILDFIINYKPLLHLTGHVHGAPFPDGEYDKNSSFSVINERTLSINTGGDELHDPEIRMALIDVEKLRNQRLHHDRMTHEVVASAIEYL